MRSGWVHLPLGEVATLDIDLVGVESGQTYPVAGVLNAGKGLFARDPVAGSDTNYATLHRLHAGQLVMRKLTAWEGPITCVPEQFDGYFVSAEFPTFTLSDHLMPEFMALVCQRPGFWEEMKDRSTGSVQRRKRVSPSQLLSIHVALPPVAEQRRIVDLIGAVDGVLGGDNRLGAAASTAYVVLLREVFGSVLADCEARPLGEVATTRLGKMLDSKRLTGEAFRYLANVNVRWDAVEMDDLKTVPLTERERDELSLRAGDTLVCEGGEAGRTAVLSHDLRGIYFQKAIHRVRCGPRLRPRFFMHFMRYATGNGLLADYMSELTIQHLTGEKLRLIPVPLPSLQRQDSVVALLDALQDLSRASARAASVAGAVRAALLTELLSGDRQVPPSYDRFLDDAA